jgi:hypothetical protein
MKSFYFHLIGQLGRLELVDKIVKETMRQIQAKHSS